MKDKLEALSAILARNGDLYNLDDILGFINDGQMQSFVGDDESWVVTRIGNYPRKKVLEIVVAVGTLDGVKSMEHSITEFAQRHGCAMVMAYAGRAGWEGEMTPGWRRTGTIFMKEI